MQEPTNRAWLLNMAGLSEAAIAIVALALGWWADVDPLKSFSVELMPVVWGVVGAVPLFLLLLISDRLPLPQMQGIKRLLTDLLGPSLNDCRWYDIVLLAAFVGFCEELLFRGLLQPWIERGSGYTHGLIWSNVLFGLVHCVTLTYGLLAAITGGYLGWLQDVTGTRSLTTPIVTHAVYDYLAFLWVARAYRKEQEAESRTL
jgi:membrane protease YdiL (CAAX protease family)